MLVCKTITYLVFNPKTRKFFTVLSLYKFKLVLQVLQVFIED